MASIERVRLTVSDYRQQVKDDHEGIVELLDGEIVTTMPKDAHQRVIGNLFAMLRLLVKAGTLRFAPVNVYLDDVNYFEPDLFWVSDTNDHCIRHEDGFWYGAPDLIIEVLSASTEKYDRGIKFDVYERYGVREYWIVNVLVDEPFIEVYQHESGKFARVGLFSGKDTFTSPLFGVMFTAAAMFA